MQETYNGIDGGVSEGSQLFVVGSTKNSRPDVKVDVPPLCDEIDTGYATTTPPPVCHIYQPPQQQ